MNFKEVLEKYKNLRPLPERKFDQFYATKETVEKRVEVILSLKIKNILFLGDDDLTSLALALTKKMERIMVVDIDQRILDFIYQISQKENLKIETLNYDLKEPLPNNLKNFDLIFFDPPYTSKAVYLWLLRALQISLGKGSNQKRKKIEFLKKKYYLLSYGYTEESLERGYKIQKVISDLGLIIQEKLRKFNKYTEAQTINNESDLYLLQPTPSIDLTKIDSSRKKYFPEKIYTYE